ncbi:MAG: class I SAM-dependent methyltransferase [Pirellulales bacterium]
MIGSQGKARVLDVGSAAGFLLRGFIGEGWSGIGIEPNSTMAHYARSELRLNVENTTFEDFETDEEFDVVTMFQVIAHFEDPRFAIEKASNLLVPGGLLLVESWNRRSFVARILGQSWHEYNPPTVRHWFSREGLDRLASQFQLTKVRSGRMTKWISAAYAKSILHYNCPRNGRFFLINHLAELMPAGLSVPYPGDDLFWSIFRKTS